MFTFQCLTCTWQETKKSFSTPSWQINSARKKFGHLSCKTFFCFERQGILIKERSINILFALFVEQELFWTTLCLLKNQIYNQFQVFQSQESMSRRWHSWYKQNFSLKVLSFLSLKKGSNSPLFSLETSYDIEKKSHLLMFSEREWIVNFETGKFVFHFLNT